MNIIGGLLGGVIGGIVGGAIWAAIAYSTGYEIGWIAWGVGFLCGIGVAVGSKGEADQMGGVIAAVLAIASILMAKYVAVGLIVDKEMKSIQAEVNNKTLPGPEDRQFWTQYVADQLIKQKKDAGEAVKWPAGVNPDDAENEADYPPEIWKDAAARWTAMSTSAKATFAEQSSAAIDRQIRESMAAISNHVKKSGFMDSFGFMDLIFGILAIATAFRVGRGSMPSAAKS